MTIWSNEIKELDNLYATFKGHLPDIVKEMEQLIKTDDPNVVMLYSRRCLEVIVTDLCETELKRPRKTEPLKGIIDKLNSEEKVPAHIITSMLGLNSMATYGAHPKDFDPDQVKPVLNNLAIIIKWYLKYKNFQIVSLSQADIPVEKEGKKEKFENKRVKDPVKETPKPKKTLIYIIGAGIIVIIIAIFGISNLIKAKNRARSNELAANDDTTLIVDSRDNQRYKTVIIGSQVWMAENLRAVKFNDGTPIPLVKNDKDWEKLHSPGYCWYNNNKKNGEMYGGLYNWYTINTGKLCPTGWHVPSDGEWTVLTKFAGDSVDWITVVDSIVVNKGIAGLKLKEAGNSHWKFQDSIFAINKYRFTALPGGYRTIYGLFWGIGEEGSWWSSSEDDEKDSKNVEMNYDRPDITAIQQYKQFGMSVRCIKNK